QVKLADVGQSATLEALRREASVRSVGPLRQQQIQAAGSDPSMKGTLDSELRANSRLLDAATRRHAELTADAAATASGAARDYRVFG
uniref:Flagellar hook-associated protein 3 n=1 Tax=Macrostomum lignano TaxID=282301 RepID=A0A1I8JMP9_9PLAT